MSEAPKNGGPAFPLHVPLEFQYAHDGMSLRDWFAAQALTGIITATSAGQHQPTFRDGDTHIRFAMARDAYEMADAMLEARSGK